MFLYYREFSVTEMEWVPFKACERGNYMSEKHKDIFYACLRRCVEGERAWCVYGSSAFAVVQRL